MSSKPNAETHPKQPSIYEIKIKGRLGSHWSDWFEGLTITPDENDTTLLTGPVIDEAALHGLLKKVRDSGLQLLLVERVESGQANAIDNEESDNSSSEE